MTVPFAAAPRPHSQDLSTESISSRTYAGTQPVLYVDDVTLVAASGPPAPTMLVEPDVTVSTLPSDRFTWNDGAGKPRVASLAQNRGGAMVEFRYQMPGGGTRVAGVTTYGNGDHGGFGYVVSHRGDGTNGIAADDSPLGFGFSGSFVARLRRPPPRDLPVHAALPPLLLTVGGGS